ncbi:hypothetical protein GCM10020218_086600 [Dactylosporangium vinaceum]
MYIIEHPPGTVAGADMSGAGAPRHIGFFARRGIRPSLRGFGTRPTVALVTDGCGSPVVRGGTAQVGTNADPFG